MKILDVLWFNLCGIVRVEDEYDGIKYYIRPIRGVQTEEQDMEDIAAYGTTFPKDAGDVLFGEKIAVAIEGRK